MVPLNRFELLYPPLLKQHLKAIDGKYYTLIRSALETQLMFQPDVETRNRKPLKRPVFFGAKWELRCGPNNCFRIFYRVDYDAHQVILLAIAEKKENRLMVGGEEIEL